MVMNNELEIYKKEWTSPKLEKISIAQTLGGDGDDEDVLGGAVKPSG